MLVSTLARRSISAILVPTLCALPANFALAKGGSAHQVEPADEPADDASEAGEPADEADAEAPVDDGNTGEEAESADEPATDESADEPATDESADEPATDEPAPAAEQPPAPAVEEGPMRPPEPKFGKHSATGRGMTIAGITLTGVGAGLIALSWVATRCNYDNAFECRYADQSTSFIPTSVAVAGLGVVLLATGLGYRTKYKRWENWNPADQAMIVPTLMKDGGGFGLVGRF